MAKEKQLPTFDLINKFHEGQAKNAEVQVKYRQGEDEAKALVQALNYRYEQALKASVTENADNEKLIDELAEQLDTAEKDLSKKKRKAKVAEAVNKNTVTRNDILRGLSIYQSEYQRDVIQPKLKELRKKKEEYISEYLELKQIIDHFDKEAKSSYFAVKPDAASVPYSVGFVSKARKASKSLTEKDLIELSQGKQPSSLSPIMKAVKENNGHIHYIIDEEENR